MQAEIICIRTFFIHTIFLAPSRLRAMFVDTTVSEQTMCEQFTTSETISGQSSIILCMRTGFRDSGQLSRRHGNFVHLLCLLLDTSFQFVTEY